MWGVSCRWKRFVCYTPCACRYLLPTRHPRHSLAISRIRRLQSLRIVQHPYDEQPALASLFATGQFRSPIQTSCKGKDEPVANPAGGTQSKPTSALDVALDIIANGKDLWEVNAQLLASVLRLLDVVWRHALENKSALEAIRKDANFWDEIVTMACAELGPIPDYQTEVSIHIDGIRRSDLREAVSSHAYRTISNHTPST
jgi:nuclear pore complex protein Nup188